MNECLQRDVQPMRYAQADGSSVPGYSPIRQTLNTVVVSNDVCCEKGCEGIEFASLLGGCADVTETPLPPTYAISVGIGITGDQCEALVEIDVDYFLTLGSIACRIPRTVTYSTEFGDDFVVVQNCCANAVDSFLAGNQLIDYLNGFCFVEEILVEEPDVPAPGSEVEFNDGADDGEGGEGVCTLLSGATQIVYKDADFAIQYFTAALSPDSYPVTIDNRMCCLAYDADGVINNSYELTFACEEIEVREDTPVYDPEAGTCTVESEVFFYVDLDANTMYDPEIDGEQFGYEVSSADDPTRDQCCLQAVSD